MTALHTTSGIVGLAVSPVLLAVPGPAGALAVGTAGAAQLLALRPMTSTWHRVALGLPALVALLAVLVVTASRAGRTGAVAGTALVLLGAVVVASAGRALADRRMSPLPGRVGDVLHWIVGGAVLPCALWAGGVLDAAVAMVK